MLAKGIFFPVEFGEEKFVGRVGEFFHKGEILEVLVVN